MSPTRRGACAWEVCSIAPGALGQGPPSSRGQLTTQREKAQAAAPLPRRDSGGPLGRASRFHSRASWAGWRVDLPGLLILRFPEAASPSAPRVGVWAEARCGRSFGPHPPTQLWVQDRGGAAALPSSRCCQQPAPGPFASVGAFTEGVQCPKPELSNPVVFSPGRLLSWFSTPCICWVPGLVLTSALGGIALSAPGRVQQGSFSVCLGCGELRWRRGEAREPEKQMRRDTGRSCRGDKLVH